MVAPDAQVWLVRHGETEWSRDHRHTSRTDLPLTAVGEQVASGLAARLSQIGFGLVLTSPLRRARDSARLAGFPDARVEPDLSEWDYGDYEGITTSQIRRTEPDWTVWTHESPGGEKADAVATRLDRVIAVVRRQPGQSLLFGHGHALRAFTARWLGLPVRDGRLWRLDTATVSVLGYERDQAVIVKWNG